MKYLYLYCITIFMFSCVSPDRIKEDKAVNPDYDKAYEYIDAGKTDSSFFFFDKARQVFLDNKDSLGVAKCLVNMAITQKDQSDYFGAQETGLQAVSYMNVNNPKHHIYLSTNYNNLGVASSALGQYKSALSFYGLALKFSNDS
ncbi:MAG: tetratricopeptide repeat protein, partial [Sphingobacterium sp.]